MGKFAKWIVGILILVIVLFMGGKFLLALGLGIVGYFVTHFITKKAGSSYSGSTSTLNYL